MKVRNGFVSNSSSSSFIISLDKDIDEYTLEEFRELCGQSGGFDPVATLYNDLKNKEESKREFDKWEKQWFDLNNLDKFEYYVSYSDNDGENMSYMEHDFVPYLDITARTINQH